MAIGKLGRGTGHLGAVLGRTGATALPAFVLGSAATQTSIRAIKSAVAGGTKKTLAILGDSTEVGRNVTRSQAPAAVMRAALQTGGLQCRSDAWFGDSREDGSGSTSAYSTYNSNVTFGSSWFNTTFTTFVGGGLWNSGSGAGALTFTPEKACDRFDVYYIPAPGNGTFTVKDGATTLATVDSNATYGFAKQVVTRASANTNSIAIQHNGVGGSIYILGIVPWNSSLAELLILNLGCSGYQTSDFRVSGQTVSIKEGLDFIDPDFCVIEFGLNDTNAGVSTATYLASVQGLINERVAAGSGIALATPQPAGAPNASYNPSAAYIQGIKDLAVTNSATCLDMNGLFGGSAAVNPTWYAADKLHCTVLGYSQKGTLLKNWFNA